jgi:hypothetical protein
MSNPKLHQCGGSEVRIIAAREFVMRTSEPKPHWKQWLASVLSIPKFANEIAANDANFRIRTLET